MGDRREIGVGVVGLGFMGRTHVGAYARAAQAGFANRLVAVCDQDAARRRGGGAVGGNFETDDGPLFDPDVVRGHAELDALLADDEVELVSVCTPTDTHVDVALAALAAGKHVLVEKPVALRAADVRRVSEAARAAKRVAMPAMCIRFWPGWDALKPAIERRVYGPLKSLAIQRLGTMPTWGGFYSDFSRSGGALADLHVHDSDLVAWCLGLPRAVSSTGSLMHMTTSYLYDDKVQVEAEGAWDHQGDFVMRYEAVFEEATVSWVLGREPVMEAETTQAIMYPEIESHDGWDGEIRHILDVIALGEMPRATMYEAVKTTRLLEAERMSLEEGRVVELSEVGE